MGVLFIIFIVLWILIAPKFLFALLVLGGIIFSIIVTKSKKIENEDQDKTHI